MTMNIHTERIKEYQFNSGTAPQSVKHSLEYRVLATLRYLYPSKYDDMVTGESPDLQDSKHNIGIEVTQAKSEKDSQADSEFSKYQKECDDEKRETCMKKVEKCGYSITHFRDEKCFITTVKSADTEKKIFQHAIKKKLGRKLREYGLKFKTLGLAIVLTDPPTTEFEDHCVGVDK